MSNDALNNEIDAVVRDFDSLLIGIANRAETARGDLARVHRYIPIADRAARIDELRSLLDKAKTMPVEDLVPEIQHRLEMLELESQA